MATPNPTRHASGARGGARGRVPAVIHPGQLSCVAALPHLDEDSATAVRRFAESAFIACPGPPTRDEYCSPILYTHDGTGFRVASPLRVLEQARLLIHQRFHDKAPLLDQPRLVRALLQVQLAAHPNAVFAALFLNRRLHLIDFVEIFHGTIDHVLVHPREVLRETLRRNAEAVIAARNDPSGCSEPSPRDIMDAIQLRYALAVADIRLLDYLIVGQSITSMAERGIL
jgi:DNA repair protein RadC